MNEVRVDMCNLGNFQSLYSTSKITVRFGIEAVTCRGSQISNLTPDKNFKRKIKK